MRKKLIVLATPSLGKVSMWWARHMADLMWPLNTVKRVTMLRDHVGGEIAETRNMLVKTAFGFENSQMELDSIFWLDDDVIVSRGALLQLYQHHAPVAAGCYFLKDSPDTPLIFPERLGGTSKFVPDTIQSVWGVHSGLTLVKADVYRSLARIVPKDKYGNDEFYKTNTHHKVEDGVLDFGGTEDLHFCDLLPQIGVRPVADMTKWTFGFHYDLDRHTGYPSKQYAEWSQAKPVTWDVDGKTVVWE